MAGENAAAGNSGTFPGTIQTGIARSSIMGGSTGLSETCGKRLGYEDFITVRQREYRHAGFMVKGFFWSPNWSRTEDGKISGSVNRSRKRSNRLPSGQWRSRGTLCRDIVNSDLPIRLISLWHRSFYRNGPYHAELDERTMKGISACRS